MKLVPILLVAVTAAPAAANTLDSVLCQRTDTRWSDKDNHSFMSVLPETKAPSVASADDTHVKVCQDVAKAQCKTLAVSLGGDLDVSADGALMIGAGANSVATIYDAKTGKVKHKLKNKRSGAADMDYSCGGGFWMGDTVLAVGSDCSEFDALPFLANGKTGAYISSLVDKKMMTNGETFIAVAHLDGKLWAINVYDHYGADNLEAGKTPNPNDLGFGLVWVIDVTTGQIKGKAHGAPGGGIAIDENGKTVRKIDKLPACSR